MKSIVKYNRSIEALECDNENNIPNFCKNMLCDKDKKCQKFYKRLISENKKGLVECPYGFYAYFVRNIIYTALLLHEESFGRVKNNIEMGGQKVSNFNRYQKQQLLDLIYDIEETENENITLNDCIHDLRNIGSYFNAMTETIEFDYKELIDNDDNIKALILLYDTINYRLDVIEGIKNQNNQRIFQKIHPQIKKLTLLMKYQAKNKNVKFDIKNEQENQVYLSRNIYLALFLLLENAVKHSPLDSIIHIDFIETDKYTEVVISNDSRKIEQEEIQKLPERGYRGINTISKGTGLGLTLAKAILDDCEADFKIEVIGVSKEKSIFKVRFKFYTYKKHREKS